MRKVSGKQVKETRLAFQRTISAQKEEYYSLAATLPEDLSTTLDTRGKSSSDFHPSHYMFSDYSNLPNQWSLTISK